MFIRIDQAPADITEQEVMNLFNDSPRVKNILIQGDFDNDQTIVWVRLNVESRAVINGIAEYLNGRYIRGIRLNVSAPLFFNDPWEHEDNKSR
ncbi:hypothetical protein [Litoribrevibacter albus]|uniref:RRM domain-containing protein n=1 Tax=Litoribrevibacter albus TaxID=1473156 RepID=A0AA37SDI5_9GAMM|nr:hypothetical protein [Litoribrevibacter albus]GLQ32388.1 hypothetical protein GCM10007876_28670 [Litoribrevibacter albus]